MSWAKQEFWLQKSSICMNRKTHEIEGKIKEGYQWIVIQWTPVQMYRWAISHRLKSQDTMILNRRKWSKTFQVTDNQSIFFLSERVISTTLKPYLKNHRELQKVVIYLKMKLRERQSFLFSAKKSSFFTASAPGDLQLLYWQLENRKEMTHFMWNVDLQNFRKFQVIGKTS